MKSDIEIKEICDMYTDGNSYTKLMRKFNMGYHSISKIIKQYSIPRKRKYSFDEKYFEDIDTQIKSYWLGFLFADGCVRERANRNTNLPSSWSLILYLKSDDSEHVKTFL